VGVTSTQKVRTSPLSAVWVVRCCITGLEDTFNSDEVVEVTPFVVVEAGALGEESVDGVWVGIMVNTVGELVGAGPPLPALGLIACFDGGCICLPGLRLSC
jgi:hypothetical protein